MARDLRKTLKAAQEKALKEALAETKKKVMSDLRSDTGLTNKALEKRVLVVKPKKGFSTGSINIAIKFGVALSEFKPIAKMVRGAKRAYEGVTVKLGSVGRNLVPGAFLRDVSSKKQRVLGHRDTMKKDGTYTKGPTDRDKGWSISPVTDILKKSATSRAAEHKAFLIASFKKYFNMKD